jgi:hypothetical protein
VADDPRDVEPALYIPEPLAIHATRPES